MSQHFLFEVTDACSMSCRYCYARNRSNAHADAEVLEKIARRLQAETAVDGVTLIGGEPLEHPHLLSIVRRLSALELRLALTTNGLALNSEMIQKLLNAGVGAFEVSLDTIDPGVFRELGRGSEVERVKYHIAELVRQGAHVTVSTVLSRANLEGIEDLVQYCFAVGVAGISLLRVLRPGTQGVGDSGLQVSDDDLFAALLRCDELSRKLGLPIACSVPVEPCRFPAHKLQHLLVPACVCGDSKWVVDPRGNLRTCELSARSLGNLLEDSFETLRARALATGFRKHNRHDHCASCKHVSQCGGGCRFLEDSRLPIVNDAIGL